MARIVVADDDADIRELVVFTLRRDGHDVTAVADGAAAVQVCEVERPDIVVLDVSMPVMTGIEACRALRKDASFARMPVILMTARSRESDVAIGLGVGADDYVSKPFSPKDLAARVTAMLERGQAINAEDR